MKTLLLIVACALLFGCGSENYVESKPSKEIRVLAVYEYNTNNSQIIYDCGCGKSPNHIGEYAYADSKLLAAFSGYSTQVACVQTKGSFVSFWKY